MRSENETKSARSIPTREETIIDTIQKAIDQLSVTAGLGRDDENRIGRAIGLLQSSIIAIHNTK